MKNPPMKMESMRTVRLQKKRILYIEVIFPESIEKIDESAKKRNETELSPLIPELLHIAIILYRQESISDRDLLHRYCLWEATQ